MRIVLVSLALTSLAFAADSPWTQWRGVSGSGVTTEKDWKTTFEDTPPKLWDAKVGRGFAAPIFRDNKLFIFSTHVTNFSSESVTCLEASTGKPLWTFEYELKSLRRTGNPAGGTPALVGDLLFAYGAGLNLHAIDIATGKAKWSKDLFRDLPAKPVPYGYQLSPIPFKNTVIVPAIVDAQSKKQFPVTEPRAGPYPSDGGVLIAFDQKTGQELWRNVEGASAWSSPMIVQLDGLTTLIHQTGRYLLGVDPETGKTRWKADLRDVGIVAEDMAASPVVQGNIIVVPIHKAYGTVARGTAGSAAYEIVQGKPKLLWKNMNWCHWFQSAAIWNDRVYAYDESNQFWCLDLKTGKELWKTKEMGTTGTKGGALLIADGKAITIDSRQNLTIVELGDKGPKILTRCQAFKTEPGYECETAPILNQGVLYCRNHTQLVCYDLRMK